MDAYLLKAVFMWCSIVNVAVFAVGYFFVAAAGDMVYRMHTRWFPMPRDSFNLVLYQSFARYKIMIVVFNIVPFVALAIAV